MAGYHGKYTASRGRRRIPLVSLVLILAAVLSLTIGGVVAYLSASTDAVKNTFTADKPTDPVVEENFANDVKTNVAVNVGDPGYAVYVRAAVVVTWKDGENGNVLGDMPELNADYTMTLGSDWFEGSDGFYYYKKPIAYDGKTDATKLTTNLITSCTPVEGKTPVGYGLNVEIIAQTIQALGTTDTADNSAGKPAVTDAWGISVNADGTLKPN